MIFFQETPAASGKLVAAPALVNIMQAGSNYAATGLNNSDQIGRAAFHRMMAILAGAKAPQKTVLPSPLITKDNVCRHYNPDSVF